MDLHDLLSALGENAAEQRNEKPKILPEAAVARLREAATHYAEALEGPRFSIGDLVTSKADMNIRDSGYPAIVVDVIPGAPRFHGDPGSIGEGRRLDMRILRVNDDMIVPFWCESWQYERWNP